MKRSFVALALLVPFVAPLPAVAAKPITAQALIDGPWQFGLYGRARDLPVGLAFKHGITAAVLTFRPDGTLRMDVPCRSEEIEQAVGGEFHVDGKWTLQPTGELELDLNFGGAARKEKYRAALENDDLVLLVTEKGRKYMGRFKADLGAACRFE